MQGEIVAITAWNLKSVGEFVSWMLVNWTSLSNGEKAGSCHGRMYSLAPWVCD